MIGVTALASAWLLPETTLRERITFVLIVGLLYLPYSVALPTLTKRSKGQTILLAMAAIDMIVVFLFQIVLPPTYVVALFGYLLITAFYAALLGIRSGLLVAVASMFLTVVAEAVHPASRQVDGFTLAMFAVSLVSMAVLVETGRREQRNARFFSLSSDLLAIAALDGWFQEVNPAWETTLGYSSEELRAQPYIAFVHPDDRDRTLAEAESYVARGRKGPMSLENRYVCKDGSIKWLAWHVVSAPREHVYYCVARDITERKHAESQLEHQASHDPLTGLPNRTLFLDRLRVALARADRHPQSVGVLFLDLDHFKVVNDSLGHQSGDRILVALGQRLQRVLRPADSVARFGGDEFVVLCEDLDDDGTAFAIAERIAEALREPVSLTHGEIYLSGSIGIALASGGAEPEALLRDADAAMYRAKERGRARIERFDRSMRDRALSRMELENHLRRAVDRDEFRLVYQPGIHLPTGRVWGVEALLRWDDPERGGVPPEGFIGTAEETGLIIPVGEWVVNEAFRQIAKWRAEDSPASRLAVSVNVSPRQFAHPDLVGMIRDAAREAGVEPSAIAVEITETALMDDPSFASASLRGLTDMGISFGVDDFGTGYSSLGELKRFRVNFLKVDRSFVSDLGRDPEDRAILAAVASLARALGVRVVAEGVESAEQLAELRTLGYDFAQGYLFAPPLPPDALTDVLRRGTLQPPPAQTGMASVTPIRRRA